MEATKRQNGSIRLLNKNLEGLQEDNLYHFGFGTKNDLKKQFGDVKFVCMGGKPKRMKSFAEFIMKEMEFELPLDRELADISVKANRYSMFKIGPVLSVSHGMGIPSLGILLHEMIKLMHYAECVDPIFIRIGSSGGVGVEGGNVVISTGAVSGFLKEKYLLPVLGEPIEYPTILDNELAKEILSLSNLSSDKFKCVLGKTMAADCFYEGQGRLDGAFCNYTNDQKLAFLRRLEDMGVANIEMEATMFAALTHRAGIRSAIVCVTMLNRLNGDQVDTPHEDLVKWETYPQTVVARLIKKHLKK